jgi:hypothetical protein
MQLNALWLWDLRPRVRVLEFFFGPMAGAEAMRCSKIYMEAYNSLLSLGHDPDSAALSNLVRLSSLVHPQPV